MASSSQPGTLHELVREHIAIDSRGTGGNVKCTCRHCNKTFTGSLTRQVAHISGRTGSGVAVCKGLDEETAAAIQQHVQRLEPINSNSQASAATEKRPAEEGSTGNISLLVMACKQLACNL